MFYIETDNIVIGVDEDRERFVRTLKYTPDLKEEDIKEVPNGYIAIVGEPLITVDECKQEKLKQAKETKLKEILDKAYEYENKTGLVSFDGRVSETETQVLHTELFNQGKFFQMVIGFSQGVLTGDQLYNTKEDINVYINAQEAQAIYFAIKNAAEKLWTVDYLYYKNLIEQAETVEDVEAVEVDYTVGYVEDTGNVEETTEDSSVVEQGD